jgi:hypothetical protein
MSTRANIVLTESYSWIEKGKEKKRKEELIFYRHSDGYPDGMLPLLNIFMNWLKEGKIRNNISQCAGWLIVLGAMEYDTIPKYETEEETHFNHTHKITNLNSIESPTDWKVGSIEPTTEIHGDIEYLYTINVIKKTLVYKHI